MTGVSNTPPKPVVNNTEAGTNDKNGMSEQATIEAMINSVAVNIMAPKIMKRAQQTMNEAINGDDDKEIII